MMILNGEEVSLSSNLTLFCQNYGRNLSVLVSFPEATSP